MLLGLTLTLNSINYPDQSDAAKLDEILKTESLQNSKIFIPMHLTFHWVCVIVDFNGNHIHYYDSLKHSKGQAQNVTKGIIAWFAKRNVNLTLQIPPNIPKQPNGYDCGIYMLMFMELVMHGIPIPTQLKDSQTKSFRAKMYVSLHKGIYYERMNAL